MTNHDELAKFRNDLADLWFPETSHNTDMQQKLLEADPIIQQFAEQVAKSERERVHKLEKIACELETIKELQNKIKLDDEDLTLVYMKGFSDGKEQLQAKVDELTNALKMINKRTSFRAVHPADLLAVNAEVNGISGQALKEVKS